MRRPSTCSRASRFLVVSSYFPPLVGGTSTVINNLLQAFSPNSFSVVSESPSSFDGTHNAQVPPGVTITRLGVPAWITKKIPYGLRIARYWRFLLVPAIERRICRIAREQKSQCIVAVYPSWPFLLAAYRAHRRLNLPLYTYYMDVSAQWQQLRWPDRPVVRFFEQRILKSAAQRLVLSEAIAEDFENRFGLDSIVVRHSSRIPANLTAAAPEPSSGPRLIVHTGVVEHLQREGLQRIASLIHAHPEWNARLVLSTPNARDELLKHGFDLPCVEIVSLPSDQVAALQRKSSLLLSVLPFRGRIESFQLTSFPTKTIEYMATNTPILAHAPADSFFGRHVRKHGYAELAGTDDPRQLAATLARSLDDQDLRKKLVARAHQTLQELFDVHKVAKNFAEACNLDHCTLRNIDDVANAISSR